VSDYLDTLASYLPALLRCQLAANPAHLNSPRVETFPAAFLFGDITGFTPLTVRLAQRGAEGVEELSILLNSYFDRLITIITSHGGDIIKFAGDAVLVVWPAHKGLESAMLRAAQCALTIQTELHNYETFEGAHLAMRIGLGGGALTLAQLGGIRGRWDAIATGLPIQQASIAEDRCQPGQIILSPEAWAVVQDDLQVELVEKEGKQALRLLKIYQTLDLQPTLLLPLTREAEIAAQVYIPRAILNRLVSGQTTLLAELRLLTVIFVNLPDFEQLGNLDDAQSLIQTLQRALYHYEGSVNQLLMENKGTTLVAALGLPPLAHEDDPARGVLAALEIQAGLRALGQHFAIGVTTGQVYCGERGNAQRREYALLGDAVNTSARLMQAVLKAGGNDVYCDVATWQAAQGRVDFDSLPPVQVKGKAAPVAIYRPMREKTAALHEQTELIGREPEKGLLNEVLQSLLRGEIQGPLIIEGEAGLGKSRLMEEVKRQAQAAGLAFFCGVGDAIERTTAYHVWRDILREGFGLAQTESLEEQRAKIEAVLPEHWRAYAPLLDIILPLSFPETEITLALKPQARLDKTRDLLEELLHRLFVRAPTVLVLEDAHWFDSASWSAITVASRLARQIPLLLILTTRPLPEPYPPEYVYLLETPGCRPWQLNPLAESETVALIRQWLKSTHVSTVLQEFIQQRVEGNPFFVEETLLALREAGVLNQTQEGCDLKPGTDQENISLPNTVQGLIANRIDRLKPAEQMTLKVASVVGRVFDAEMVRAVYPQPAGCAELDQQLRVLQAADFITPFSTGSYVFKNALTREAVYNQMLFAQRRQLHRAVANWVEQMYAADLEPHYALLAYHWRHALGNLQEDAALTAKTLTVLEKAGEQAAARLTYMEAAEFFSRALNLAAKLPIEMAHLALRLRRMRWLTALGIAQDNLGRTAESLQSLEQVLRLGGYAMPKSTLGLYLGILQEVVIQAWHRLRPAFLTSARTDECVETLRVMAEADAWLFLPYFFNNQFIYAVLTTFKAVNLAEALTVPPNTLATSYGILGYFIGLARPNPLASVYENLALNTPLVTSEPTLQSAPDTLLSMRFIGQGQWDQARAYSEKALVALEQQMTAYRARGNLLTQLCFCDYYQGRYASQLEKADLVGQIGRMSNNLEFQAWHLQGWAMDHSAMGYFEALQADLEKLKCFLPNIPGSDLTHLFLLTYQAPLALVRQDWVQAEACVAQLEQMLARSPFPFYFSLDSYVICAEVPLTLWRCANHPTDPAQIWRWQAAAHRANRALQRFARIYPIGRSAALRCIGNFAWLKGQMKKAQRCWQASLEAARKVSMPRDEALAHWALGRLSVPERPAHRQEARNILEQLGAGAYFEHLKKEDLH
jgi:class 3 adenylate cyclase